MNYLLKKFKRQNGSILLETLISIVILGLIVVGSFYSYSIFHQRILFQRHQRIVLGILQGWMEKAISSVLDPIYLNDPDLLRDPNELSRIERDLMGQFEQEIYRIFHHNINFDPSIAFIDSNIIFIDPNILDPTGDNMIAINISVILNGLPIHFYTEINPENHI